ncbi:hypothetical protein BGZ58_007908 [Dissophora ornata]|nr:hypothetical protein BGZ58_007908 [Dissophora ornata]
MAMRSPQQILDTSHSTTPFNRAKATTHHAYITTGIEYALSGVLHLETESSRRLAEGHFQDLLGNYHAINIEIKPKELQQRAISNAFKQLVVWHKKGQLKNKVAAVDGLMHLTTSCTIRTSFMQQQFVIDHPRADYNSPLTKQDTDFGEP